MAAAAHDLAELLDLPCCECFNADDDHPLRNALAAECRDDAGLLLESDVDEGAQQRVPPTVLRTELTRQASQSC